MPEETTSNAASFAKTIAVETVKSTLITLAGVGIAVVVLGAVGTVAEKLRERKAAKQENQN